MPIKNKIAQNIKKVVFQIVKKYRPEKIILFGSAASGKHSEHSDVDLLIIKNKVPKRGIDRQLIIDKLIDRHGFAMDMLVYRPSEISEGLKMGDSFIKEIIQTGKTLYVRH